AVWVKAPCAIAVALLALAACPTFAQSDLPVDLTVPAAPIPFEGGGKTHLVYELQIWNYAAAKLSLKRFEVLSDSGSVASWEGADLLALFFGRQNVLEGDVLGQGLRAVAYIWITFDSPAAVPARLHHRLTSGGRAIDGAEVLVSTAKPVVIGAPLRGADWIAANGPANDSAHRRTVVPVAGKARIAQRFAIDWIQAGADGTSFTGAQNENRSYHAYGAEVLAVADGVVTETRDAIPENVPDPSERAVPITLDTIGGNHVILDIGGGHYAIYLHLQPGSLRVKTGQRVRRGETLALVGNSGNSSQPHLHFQITDGSSVLGSEGLPWLLDSFSVSAPGGNQPRTRQLPLRNEKISFDDAAPQRP